MPAGYGRGAIEYTFRAVCGGCERKIPLTSTNPTGALAEIVGKGWGEDATLGIICPGCVRKVARAKIAEGKRIILTDASGKEISREESGLNGDNAKTGDNSGEV